MWGGRVWCLIYFFYTMYLFELFFLFLLFLLLRIILRLCPWHVYTWIGSLSSCWASCPGFTSLASLLHTDKHLWYVDEQVSSHKPEVFNLRFTDFDEFVEVHVNATVPHLSSIQLTLQLPSESEGKASRKKTNGFVNGGCTYLKKTKQKIKVFFLACY